MLWIIIKLAIVMAVIITGKTIKSHKKDVLAGFFSGFGKTDYRLIRNYIGNLIMFSPIPWVAYTIGRWTAPVTYIMTAVYFLTVMVFHLHDITGKPIDVILPKMVFSTKQLRQNVFMRITAAAVVSQAVIYLVVSKLGNLIMSFFVVE